MNMRDHRAMGRRMLAIMQARHRSYLRDCAEVQAIDRELTPEQRTWLDEQLAAEGLTAEAAQMLTERV